MDSFNSKENFFEIKNKKNCTNKNDSKLFKNIQNCLKTTGLNGNHPIKENIVMNQTAYYTTIQS